MARDVLAPHAEIGVAVDDPLLYFRPPRTKKHTRKRRVVDSDKAQVRKLRNATNQQFHTIMNSTSRNRYVGSLEGVCRKTTVFSAVKICRSKYLAAAQTKQQMDWDPPDRNQLKNNHTNAGQLWLSETNEQLQQLYEKYRPSFEGGNAE